MQVPRCVTRQPETSCAGKASVRVRGVCGVAVCPLGRMAEQSVHPDPLCNVSDPVFAIPASCCFSVTRQHEGGCSQRDLSRVPAA